MSNPKFRIDEKSMYTILTSDRQTHGRSVFLICRLQALDEEYLKVDAQFGGVDQRKIFTFAEKVSLYNKR